MKIFGYSQTLTPTIRIKNNFTVYDKLQELNQYFKKSSQQLKSNFTGRSIIGGAQPSPFTGNKGFPKD